MKCPFCHETDNRVIDSRLSKDGNMVRRRRECLKCTRRFTTYERVEETMPLVIKKDGRREPFDRDKVLGGMIVACKKRPVSMGTLSAAVDEIEQAVYETGYKEIDSEKIGEMVAEALGKVDQIAYVRFASVYRQFKDVGQFMVELKDILNRQKPKAKR